MDPAIMTILDAQGGVASVLQITAAGTSRHVLRRAVQRREVLRLPRGIIVDPVVWRDAAPWDRHVIRARGLMHGPAGVPGGSVALSHHSALSLLDLPLFGVDDRVHIVRGDGKRSSSDDLVASHAAVDPRWIHECQGVRAVVPDRAVLQVAATFGVEAGLVSADACLRRGLCDKDGLREALAAGGYGKGSAQATRVAQHADKRAESAGESRCRWIFTVLGLPTALPQAQIKDARDEVIARVDFLFEAQRTVVEFDGMGKYTKPKDVRAEKMREDAIRSLKYAVVRITWKDLQRPELVRFKVLRGFEQAQSFL